MPALAIDDGPRIAYDDTGGDRPALVFSHGILMDRSMFEPQVAALGAEYRCVSWDQRGHGDTTAPPGPYSYWDSARDLLALLDHLDIATAVLAGMSQGGFVSLRATLLDPDRTRALVLLDTQAGTELPGAGEAYLELAETAHDSGLSDQLAGYVAALVIGQEDRCWEPWLTKWRERGVDDAALEAVRTLTTRDDITARLGDIRCPALVVHGDADASIPLDRAGALADGLPGAAGVTVVPGAGHAANLTHPVEVNRVIREFLAGLPGG
jgi:3-oxoadipate enol-lactonase